MQFDKLVSALIGVHAFTVLGPQVLVLQKMLAAIWPKGKRLEVPLQCLHSQEQATQCLLSLCS